MMPNTRPTFQTLAGLYEPSAIQQLPAEDGHLYNRLIRGVERELLEQVLPLCDDVLVKAAARLLMMRPILL